MTRAWWSPLVVLLVAVLPGCTTGNTAAGDASSSPPTSSATTSPSPLTPTPSMSTSASTDDAAVAIYICTEGIAEPDQLVLDATKAARAGTRSPAEVVEAFRQAQDMVEALSDQAEADGLWFSETLQDYADVIGRLRVSGDGDLEDLLEAREKINTSCLIPTPSS